jgi:hypothetical protein
MLSTRRSALAERRDVHVQRRLVALIVDREPQVTDAAAIRQLPKLGVAGQLTDKRDTVDIGCGSAHGLLLESVWSF